MEAQEQVQVKDKHEVTYHIAVNGVAEVWHHIRGGCEAGIPKRAVWG